MSETKHWITKLIPTLAFAAGIIMASIGGMITLSSSLKLALFEHDPYTVITEENCRFDYYQTPEKPEELVERTEEEKAQCVQARMLEEKTRYQNNHKDNIVDGVSALLVGGFLIYGFRRKNDK